MTAALLRFNRRTFLSLHKHRNYRYYFAGQVVSLIGTWMQRAAQSWLVLQLTHSGVAVGILVFASFLPFTLFTLHAGALIDRMDARRVVIGTQAAQMALSIVLAAIALLGVVQPWHVYVLAFLAGTVTVVDAPARQALTYRMVGPGELPNAVGLNSSLFNGSRIFGPALAGIILAVASAGVCFAVNAVSFLAVLLGLLLMRPDEFHPLERHERPATMWRGIMEGLRYVRSERDPLIVLVVITIVSTLCFNFPVLLPVLAKQTLHAGPQTFGSLMAVFGAGALVGALVSAAIGRASMKMFLVGSFGFCVTQILLAPERSTIVAGVILFFTGLFFTTWTSASNTTLQLSAPDHLRGRVVSLFYYAFNGLAPLGGLLAGWLTSVGGTNLAFASTAVIGAVATAAAAILVRRSPEAPAPPVRNEQPDRVAA
jgi:MFS family permease